MVIPINPHSKASSRRSRVQPELAPPAAAFPDDGTGRMALFCLGCTLCILITARIFGSGSFDLFAPAHYQIYRNEQNKKRQRRAKTSKQLKGEDHLHAQNGVGIETSLLTRQTGRQAKIRIRTKNLEVRDPGPRPRGQTRNKIGWAAHSLSQ
jgi:hypothetical protein